jgi:hypothetical protein
MDLKSFCEILKTARTFVDKSDFQFKNEIVQTLDALAWIIKFLIKVDLKDFAVKMINDSLNEQQQQEPAQARANDLAKDQNKTSSNETTKIHTLSSIKSDEDESTKSSSSSGTGSKSIPAALLKILLEILPYSSKLIKLAHLIYCKCCKNQHKLNKTIETHHISNCVAAVQVVSYLLYFGLLVWGFYAIYNAEKSNLTDEKRKELTNMIDEIRELIGNAEAQFNNRNWERFQYFHEIVRDKIDDFRDQVDKLKCEIQGHECSLGMAKQNANFIMGNSVLGAAITIFEIVQNPACILPKVFLT